MFLSNPPDLSLLTDFILVCSQLEEVINFLEQSGPAVGTVFQHCDVGMREAPKIKHIFKYIYIYLTNSI